MMARRDAGVVKVAVAPGTEDVEPRAIPPRSAERCIAAGRARLAGALMALEGERRDALAAQVADLDLDLVGRPRRRFVLGDEEDVLDLSAIAAARDRAPAARMPRGGREAEARERGERALREGVVAVVLLAGGQGTRLGFDGPKGDYPFAPVTGRTLFAHHAAKVRALRDRYDAALPWYILTSPANDADTRAVLRRRNDHFGLDPSSVRFVVQGTLPAVDRQTGAVLLEAPDRIALSPDGHGGLLVGAPALRRPRRDGRAGGVTTIFTFQVDNPLVRVARPEFLGHHLLAGAEMSNVAVRKVAPEERMGVVARLGGSTAVVEYSDLPDELAQRREPDGSLTFWAGSIAVHLLEVDFVERLTEGGLALPYHRAIKRVPHIGDARSGGPNAIKFETFLFDALPFAERSVTIEAAREEEFSPIKNAEGADSPETARADLNRLYARWIEAAGGSVARGPDGEPVDLEIDPRYALDAAELAERLPDGLVITEPTALPAG